MITPEVQAQVAEYFGEAPANPKACKYLDATYGDYGLKNFCQALRGERPELLQLDLVLEDPAGRLRRQPRPDLRGLLGVDPGLDGDQGLTPGRGRDPSPVLAPAHDHRSSIQAPPQTLRRRLLARALPASPAAAAAAARRRRTGWFGVVYLGSLAVLFVAAFWYLDPLTSAIKHDLTLQNFQTLISNPVYRTITLRTVGMAALVTVIDALLAFPVAYYMARYARRPDAGGDVHRSCCCRSGRATSSASTRGASSWATAGRSSGRSPQFGIPNVVLVPERPRHPDRVHVHLAAVHDPADLRGAGAAARPRCSRRRATSAARPWHDVPPRRPAARASRPSSRARSSRSA